MPSPLYFFQNKSSGKDVTLALVLSILLIAAAPIAFAAVTLAAGQDEYYPSDQLTVTGTSAPDEDITFKVENPNGAQVAVGQTAADTNGDFSATLLRFPSASTTTFPFGSYTITATGSSSDDTKITVTFTESAAAPAPEPAAPAAVAESTGLAVAVSVSGTYNSGDSVSIYIVTTDDGVLRDVTLQIVQVNGPSGSENIRSTCRRVSTGLNSCSYTVSGGVGTYAVLVSASSSSGSNAGIATFQVADEIEINIPPVAPGAAPANLAPLENAINNVARDIDALDGRIGNVQNAVGGISLPAAGANIGQIQSALDGALADIKSAVSGTQAAISDDVGAAEDNIEDAVNGIASSTEAAAAGSSQAASMAMIAAILAAIAVILQIVIIVRGNILSR